MKNNLLAAISPLEKLRQHWDDQADDMKSSRSFDYRCGLQQCEAELGAILSLIKTAVSAPSAPASEREPLPCGCIPAIINPTCSQGHVSGAFVLKSRMRPGISLDLEDYQ